ncbi:amino acid permease [Lactobacillus sp. LC28-10]|uniref:Amino acid permease n=1 Tax=Secundilactobacillus angelensis TaxID=2722706 RepID=A0ABX1KX30_9LACO|nr:amino acid permease [Secundilactobacillus angelensis]MCH5461347.1 amino acid permease [Secundilactobacillus angelensis]NLR17840.1 amino acid permease [Secundilactobacillus angelensis]
MANKIDINLVLKNASKSEEERTLSLFDLSILGIGAIIGTGILVLTGIVASTDAGPAVIFSFLIAALASGLIGLCYSELTTSMPNSGSAYVYAWVSIGQVGAFFAGWTLIGVYITTTATVANGWTGYLNSFLREIGIDMPAKLLASPFAGGIINLPAVIMIVLITFVLTKGTSESKWINNTLVLIKLAIIILFISVAVFNVRTANWHPFMPYGPTGVFTGASTVFFTYLGFDALATSAEDAKNVKKNLPRAIIISLIVSTTLYIMVSLIMTGVVSYKELNVPESMSFVLLAKGHTLAAQFVSAGAVLGIMAVVYAFVYAGSNITMAMGRGGFLPKSWAQKSKKSHSPNTALWLNGLMAAILAGLMDIRNLAIIANVGSLTVFALISLIVIVLRRQQPELNRPFKIPFGYTIPILSVLVCIFLLANIALNAWLIYFGWLVIGFILYGSYSVKHIDALQEN